MRFRTIILLSFLLLEAGLSAVALPTVAVVLDRAARRGILEDLRRGRQVFEDLQAYRQSLFSAQCRVMAEEPRLKAVVDAQDVSAETVLGVAIDLRKVIWSDLFLITSASGELIADVDDPTAGGFNLSKNAVVSAALAGGQGAGIWFRGESVYQVLSCRLTFGTTPVGALVIGYALDDQVAETVLRQTGDSLVVELDGQPVAASALAGGKKLARGTLRAALLHQKAQADTPIEVQIAGVRYLALGAPLPGYEGPRRLRYLIARSLDSAMEPARQLTQLLIGIAAVAICLALGLAVVLSRRLSRPLDELVAFTGRIAGGELSARASLTGSVELTTLGEAMNRMVAELAESRRHMAEKERMHRELEIASRIQTSILPRHFEVPGLEMSALMIPADEVGGDYYDVLPCPGGAWIGIGDVAGHGLTAGLVMMMIQSSLATLVREQPDKRPKDVLRVLNALLFDNIRQRLGQDEHVTLTLLHYREDGHFLFAGAHEEIVVCRSGAERCEEIATPGTWLGAIPDVGRHMVDSELTLLPGNLMALYTDGVVQAMDEAGDQFGMERLSAEILAARQRPVAEIRDRVIDAVKRFTSIQYDDVTLMILRYHGKTPGAPS